MRKVLKVIGWIFLVVLVLGVGFAIYVYQSTPMLQAIVHNDESKLYYFPTKGMEAMHELSYTEHILEVEDSVQIYTYYFKSSHEQLQANIFFIHGAGGNVSRYQHLIKPLVENGFGVYALDWRGYGNSNGVPGYRGVLKDTQLAFAHFTETKADTSKVIVYGMSLGGQLAVKITKDNQDQVDALVLDGSIESAQKLAIDYAPMPFLKQKAAEHPEDFNQEYVAVKDIEAITDTPKLIIHSKNDREVSFAQGEHLFEAARQPKAFWETDTEHMMTLKQYPKETIEKIHALLH